MCTSKDSRHTSGLTGRFCEYMLSRSSFMSWSLPYFFPAGQEPPAWPQVALELASTSHFFQMCGAAPTCFSEPHRQTLSHDVVSRESAADLVSKCLPR